MFVKKDLESEETSLTTFTKLLISIFTVISMIAGAVFYLENTYEHKADAKEMKIYLEKETVSTLKSYQKYFDTKQMYIQQKYNIERLEDLRDHEVLLEAQIKQDPNNPLLQNKLKIIKTKIKKLENKIYGD